LIFKDVTIPSQQVTAGVHDVDVSGKKISDHPFVGEQKGPQNVRLHDLPKVAGR
jgi:hypothetical protein